ncbi:MAG: hypothetical protein WCK74_05450 [Gemmatimonadaceae bacterium]
MSRRARWGGVRHGALALLTALLTALLATRQDAVAQSRSTARKPARAMARGKAPTSARTAAQAPAAAPQSLLPLGVAPPAYAVTVRVYPETVSVGQPFTATLSMSVSSNATVTWGTITDTAAVVSQRQPPQLRTTARPAMRIETAEYSLAAWDLGTLPLGLPAVTVHTLAGDIPVSVPIATIAVRSVLPGDTAQRVPKPPRALFPRLVPWWRRWWPAGVVLVALALLWWLSRRRRTPRAPRPVASERRTPYDEALQQFAHLDRLALPESGEPGRAVVLAVDVVRSYLAARRPALSLAGTSAELLTAVSGDALLPRDLLVSLLAEADAVKFAQRTVSAEAALALLERARAFVDVVAQADRAAASASATLSPSTSTGANA